VEESQNWRENEKKPSEQKKGNPEKTEKWQHTEQKPEREDEPNKDYTERGIAFTIAFVPVDNKKPENKQGEKRKRNWGEKEELKKNKIEERRQWQCLWDSPSTLSSSSAIASNRNQSVSFFLWEQRQRGGQGNKKPTEECTSITIGFFFSDAGFQNQRKKLKKQIEEQHAIAFTLLPGKCLQFCKIIHQHCALET